MSHTSRLAVLLALLAGAGCTRSTPEVELLPVTGTVTWNKMALAGAVVTFTPTGDTRGAGAVGRTDAKGVYRLTNVRGGNGVAAGEFRVTISKRLMPDGTPVPENDTTPPIDSPARETLPPEISHFADTKLIATVARDTQTIDFHLPTSP